MKMTTCELLAQHGLLIPTHPSEVCVIYKGYILLIANSLGISVNINIVDLVKEIAYTYMPRHQLIDNISNIHNPSTITINSSGIRIEYVTASSKMLNIITSTGMLRGYTTYI